MSPEDISENLKTLASPNWKWWVHDSPWHELQGSLPFATWVYLRLHRRFFKMINLIIWHYSRNINVRHYLCLNPFVPFMHTLYINMIYYSHLVVQIIKSTCASFSYIINYIVDKIFLCMANKKPIGFREK